MKVDNNNFKNVIDVVVFYEQKMFEKHVAYSNAQNDMWLVIFT